MKCPSCGYELYIAQDPQHSEEEPSAYCSPCDHTWVACRLPIGLMLVEGHDGMSAWMSVGFAEQVKLSADITSEVINEE